MAQTTDVFLNNRKLFLIPIYGPPNYKEASQLYRHFIFCYFFLREHKMDVHRHKYTYKKMKKTSATFHLTLQKEADNLFCASLSKSPTFFKFSEQITVVLEMLLLVKMF